MLTEKTTPDRATMLHSEFPISPTWRANCQGVRRGRSARGDPSGCRLIDGGSGPKSVGGSSQGELRTRRELRGHKGLDWFRPPESKTLRPVCGGIGCEWGSPLELSSRPPYVASGLWLSFNVDGPSWGLITD
jgi:hypothetical protein